MYSVHEQSGIVYCNSSKCNLYELKEIFNSSEAEAAVEAEFSSERAEEDTVLVESEPKPRVGVLCCAVLYCNISQ